MPDRKQEYIRLHIDDAALVEQLPNYKDRLHELERQFAAGKMRPPPGITEEPADRAPEPVVDDAPIDEPEDSDDD